MNIDLEKRRMVMERSMALGHCICDPRRGCPCDVFRDDGICPCAGERPEPVALDSVKLTSLVRNAGCASKIAPADLDAVLRRLPPVTDSAVISGLAAADDAAIYRIAPDLCLVQTVDVFTPCVDDPRLFGRICAANCLSDIYAMGGVPRTALSILAFPSETLDGRIMFEMLAGAMETLAEAGVALVGGHSIKDEEIKLGFAVTGTIDPEVSGALERPAPGDLLVLTKPLGTGVLAFAAQIGRAPADGLAAAAESMARLNRSAAEAMREAGATACTDITGFGLFGHLARLARQGGLSAEIRAASLPALPGAVDLLAAGVIPGAIERNREYVSADLEVGSGVPEPLVHLGCDAQTSGGLLIGISPSNLEKLLKSLARWDVDAGVVGHFIAGPAGRIRLVDAETLSTPSPTMSSNPSHPEPAHSPDCCADVFGQAPAKGTSAESQQAFAAFMKTAQAGGSVNEKTKELILFALVLQSRCGPCFQAHYHRAKSLGLTRDELDEAAWCAVAMGGAPVRMFYHEEMQRAERGGAEHTGRT